MMESKTLHYLHPDFDGSYEKPESPVSSLLYWNSSKATNIFSSSAFCDKSKITNNSTPASISSKRPSPLALLAETCNSIGGGNDTLSNHSTVSPSNNTQPHKPSKRHHSELNTSKQSKRIKTHQQYQISSPSSSLSSITSSSSSASKLLSKPSSISTVESTRADTSSQHCQQFPSSANNQQIPDEQEMKKLNAVASSILHCLQQQITDLKYNNNSTFDNSNVNLNQILDKMIQQNNHQNQVTEPLPIKSPQSDYRNDKSPPFSNDNGNTGIKFCLYCGKYIPYLPILVAHIHQHITPASPPPNQTSPTVSLIDFLLKLSPTNQNPTFLPPTNHNTPPVLDCPTSSLFINTNPSPLPAVIGGSDLSHTKLTAASSSSSSATTPRSPNSISHTSNFHNIHRLIY